LDPPKRPRLILGKFSQDPTTTVNWSVAAVYFTRSVA
jgi:hypothetical protein